MSDHTCKVEGNPYPQDCAACDESAASPSSGAPETPDEIAWLIERTENGYAEWIAKYEGDTIANVWTTDASRAQRFASKSQAGSAILLHLLTGKSIQGAKPTEHMWTNAGRPSSGAPSETPPTHFNGEGGAELLSQPMGVPRHQHSCMACVGTLQHAKCICGNCGATKPNVLGSDRWEPAARCPDCGLAVRRRSAKPYSKTFSEWDQHAGNCPIRFRDYRKGGRGTIAQRLRWLEGSCFSRDEVVEELSSEENTKRQAFYEQQFAERRDALIADVEALFPSVAPNEGAGLPETPCVNCETTLALMSKEYSYDFRCGSCGTIHRRELAARPIEGETPTVLREAAMALLDFALAIESERQPSTVASLREMAKACQETAAQLPDLLRAASEHWKLMADYDDAVERVQRLTDENKELAKIAGGLTQQAAKLQHEAQRLTDELAKSEATLDLAIQGIEAADLFDEDMVSRAALRQQAEALRDNERSGNLSWIAGYRAAIDAVLQLLTPQTQP